MGRTLSIVLTAACAMAFAAGFGILSRRVLSGVDADTALGIISLFGTIWLAIWSFNRTKQKEAESRLFSERAAVYEQLLIVLKRMMLATKGLYDNPDPTDLARDLADIKFKMIAWGGQRTLRAIARLEELPPGSEAGPTFLVAGELYAAIRLDLGHDDDKTFADDLVISQIVGEEREAARNALVSARATMR